jgi:uncharacterized protein YciI
MIPSTMSKQHYFFKLIPPRPTFVQDMTEQEKLLMKEHARHIQQHFEVGKILVYGPVMASGGAFGLAIFEVANESEVRQFGENDPTVRAGLNKFEFYPMQVAAAHALQG